MARRETFGVLTRLADALPVGIATVDTQGRQRYVNDAFARMVGWSREALVGAMPPFAYWPPDQLHAIQEAFDRTLRRDVPPEGFTLVFQRRDGTRFDALVHLGPVGPIERPEEWAAVVVDVSAQLGRARRLEALQRAAAELTASLTPRQVADVVMRAAIPAVGGARGSVAVLTADGSALETIAFLGYPPEVRDQYRLVPIDFAFPLSDAVHARAPLYFPDVAARRARYPHLGELLELNGAGAMASLPLMTHGRVIGAIGINWNEDHAFAGEEASFLEAIAQQCAQALERSRLYEEERRARREAEDANRAKSDFLAAMSHELRTPLNGIAGYVDLLELEIRGPLTDAQRADLARIRFNQRHLASLIDDVLSFARIEAGKLEVLQVPVPMDEVLRAVQPLVVQQIDVKGIHFTYEPCPPQVEALGDADRIVQICVNLLSNAGKATPAGGEVRLSCAAVGAQVLVRVSDTGCGIPADRLEAIFSPFTQLGRSLRAPQAGTGLGLSISRGLAEAMHGTLTVESEVGVGSTFTLALPAARTDR